MTHEHPPITTADARKLHPRAAIIRHEVSRTIVFDIGSDAIGHPTGQVQVAPNHKLHS